MQLFISCTVLLVSREEQKLEARRVPTQHPTEEMEDGEYKTFRRKDDPSCNLRSLYFTVLKTENRFTSNDLHVTYYAITGEDTEFTQIPRATLKRKFVNQIAVIQCTHGWIDDLEVFEESLNPGGPTEKALRCGIGTVLTELCLIDPDISAGRQGNLAGEMLEEFPEFTDRVMRNCHHLVGLRMATKKKATAHVYFNAAINMIYGLLLIEDFYGPDSNSIKIYPTQAAKDNYDSDTGRILPCGQCSETCQAWGRRWFFCAGTDPRRILA